jgi:hypothetical protein
MNKDRKQFREEELAQEAWREAYEEFLADFVGQEAMEEARQILGLNPGKDEPQVLEAWPVSEEENELIHRIKQSRDSMNEPKNGSCCPSHGRPRVQNPVIRGLHARS